MRLAALGVAIAALVACDALDCDAQCQDDVHSPCVESADADYTACTSGCDTPACDEACEDAWRAAQNQCDADYDICLDDCAL